MIDPSQYPEEVRDVVGHLAMIDAANEVLGRQLDNAAKRASDKADVIAARDVARVVGISGAISAAGTDPT